MGFPNFSEKSRKVMKATGQKLKKLRTKQVYGFKKEAYGNPNSIDPTLTTSATCTLMFGGMVHAQ